MLQDSFVWAGWRQGCADSLSSDISNLPSFGVSNLPVVQQNCVVCSVILTQQEVCIQFQRQHSYPALKVTVSCLYVQLFCDTSLIQQLQIFILLSWGSFRVLVLPAQQIPTSHWTSKTLGETGLLKSKIHFTWLQETPRKFGPLICRPEETLCVSFSDVPVRDFFVPACRAPAMIH